MSQTSQNDMQDMEETINTLIRADARAQQTLRQSQQRRQQMADTVQKAREDLQRDYGEQAARRIEAVRAIHRTDYDEELRRMRDSYDGALRELGETFEKRHGEWVETLTRRCLE